jgi:hypothetical protein
MATNITRPTRPRMTAAERAANRKKLHRVEASRQIDTLRGAYPDHILNKLDVFITSREFVGGRNAIIEEYAKWLGVLFTNGRMRKLDNYDDLHHEDRYRLIRLLRWMGYSQYHYMNSCGESGPGRRRNDHVWRYSIIPYPDRFRHSVHVVSLTLLRLGVSHDIRALIGRIVFPH